MVHLLGYSFLGVQVDFFSDGRHTLCWIHNQALMNVFGLASRSYKDTDNPTIGMHVALHKALTTSGVPRKQRLQMSDALSKAIVSKAEGNV